VFRAKPTAAAKQRSLAGRYAPWVQGLSLLAFAWAFLGWLNHTTFDWWDSPIWLSRYTEYAIVLGFGLWRIQAEHNPYTRKRLIALVACVTVLWWLIPWLFPFVEPHLGFRTDRPLFPSLHTPGTVTFFAVLAAVFLFGRRVICGWNCPCVGIRETVGFPFRHVTLRGKLAWRLRHTKWVFFALYLGAGAAILIPPNGWTTTFIGLFGLLVVLPYFATLLLSPLIGNRAYCRYLCPFGATFGLLNRAGPFRIDFDDASCNDCGICSNVCDMGIPVLELGRGKGRIDAADCMGCGRCVSECGRDSLAFRDARAWVRPGVVRSRRRLRAWANGAVSGARWQTAAFAGLLTLALVGAWWVAGRAGAPNDLATDLMASLCLTH